MTDISRRPCQMCAIPRLASVGVRERRSKCCVERVTIWLLASPTPPHPSLRTPLLRSSPTPRIPSSPHSYSQSAPLLPYSAPPLLSIYQGRDCTDISLRLRQKARETYPVERDSVLWSMGGDGDAMRGKTPAGVAEAANVYFCLETVLSSVLGAMWCRTVFSTADCCSN